MRLNKKITLLAFFLIGIVILSFILLAYSSSNPQLTSPGAGSFGYLGRQGVNIFPTFNEEMCNAGQDFVIQIPPFGCVPAIVRSDLLEEQNVPVFCQLSATKINPLIDVEAIDSLSFKGNYPEGIQGIGFHPARAAVRSTQRTLLNSPVLQNIGYAVILLKQQKNESSMPDFISGEVTANIRYDIKNAFGIGKATQYLPEFTEDEWSENFRQYGFWDGRAFLRAETVGREGAIVSIYLDENNKLSTSNLGVGKTSGNIFLPGFSCLASLQLRLDGVEDPDTRVRLNINGEIVQVTERGKFLDNSCRVIKIEKQGLVQKTEIVCSTDEGGERFNLLISPKIKLEVVEDGVREEKKVGIGDFLYENEGKFIYLGYLGTKGNNPSLENLFVYLFLMPTKVDRLSDAELSSISRLADKLKLLGPDEVSRVTSIKVLNTLISGAKAYIGLANYAYKYTVEGKDISYLEYNSEEKVFGRSVKIVDFATPVDQVINEKNFKINFDKAMKDYRTIIRSFLNEKQRPDDPQTFGQKALINATQLAFESQQKRTLFDLCNEFEGKYPDDKPLVGKFCESGYKLSNSEISEHSVFVNGRVKSISLEGIYEPTFEEYSAEIFVRNKTGHISTLILRNDELVYLNEDENEFIQLESLDVDSARIRVNLVPQKALDVVRKFIVTDTGTLKIDTPQGFGSNYVFTLTEVNLEKVAKVSVLPSIKNAGTEANFSFNIQIEKRAIQLSPEKTKKRIKNLNESIDKWEDRSEKLGKVVRGFNAACLAVGTTLTIKNLIGDFDGRAIARQEVMRSDNGWYDICKEKVTNAEYSSVDSCLLANSDQIDRDVDFVENIINDQEGITDENIVSKLSGIKTSLGSRGKDPDVSAALTEEGFKNGKVTLTQARDIERLALILNSNPDSELKKLAEKKLDLILKGIKVNSQNFALHTSLQNQLNDGGFSKLEVDSYGKKGAIQAPYNGADVLGSKISGAENLESDKRYPTKVITLSNVAYLLILDGSGSNYFIGNNGEHIYRLNSISEETIFVSSASEDEKREVRQTFSSFKKVDSTSYNNQFKDPKVRFFETEPYKGLPALVPFDIANGWYVAAKQTLPGAGALRDSSIRAYDDSGRISSFYLCNVGPNGKEEFNSLSIRDDECMGFNPGFGQINQKFPGLSPSQTNQKVEQAKKAITQASRARQRDPNLKGKIRILNENIDVGEPEVGLPDIQCQDFMSPDDCHILFNTCDPVVCPSSRCDFGGSYPVSDVIQSGIIGSTLLCLPNIQEKIYVPICLTGVKAGIDSFISVQENYRNCLQTNLDTGETVGICDEIHSIYLCDFFWSQALPLSQVLVPKAIEYVAGQTGRGGGEYLGVATAWRNAGDSVDYITNYYGANSFEAFKTGVIKEVGHAFCKSFISASYPDINFLDSVLEPESPPQYTGWFSERSFSTATVPAISQYKVFYHIFAGENEGAYFSVYLRSPVGTSFYQTNPTLNVANGFIPKGGFASETKDFTAVSGYRELCINVNGQEECGFSQVSTDFGLDYLQDQYLKEQASQTNIQTENECISGTPSLYSFATPNLQAGAEEFINPSLYREQIVRVCSTSNPDKGTDPRAGTLDGRWVEVGTCDRGKGNLKCYLDRKSVERAIEFEYIENETLEKLESDTLSRLRREGGFINLGEELNKIDKLNAAGKINYISQSLLDRALLSNEKATLILIRGNAYAELALKEIKSILDEKKVTVKAPPSLKGIDPYDFFGDEGEEFDPGIDSDLAQKGDVGEDTGELSEEEPITTILSQEVPSFKSSCSDNLEKCRIDLDFAIDNLSSILSTYGTLWYTHNNPIYKNLVDEIYGKGILTDREYDEIKTGVIINNDAAALKKLLENKRNLLSEDVKTEGLKIGNECLEGAEWVDKSFNSIDDGDNPPGKVFVKLKIKSIDSCKGYSLLVRNVQVFGSEITVPVQDLREIQGNYFLPYTVDVLKKGTFSYEHGEYKFKIHNQKNEEIFVGESLTVKSILSRVL